MKKQVIAILAVAAVAAAAAYYIIHRPHTTAGNIMVSGNIEVTDVEVSFKIPGRVKERLVDEGEMVKDGQIVGRLESNDQLHDVAARQAAMQTAKAALAELEAGSRKEEIGQAEAQLARAKAEESRLQKDFVRQEALYRKDVISTREFDAAGTSYDAARASVREASERVKLVREGPRRETIDQARARLRDAEAALALAKTRLGYTTLTSPLKGVVLSKNVEPGEQVAAGTPVITVGEIESVWVRAYINETDLGRVKVGQKARVRTDTYPGKIYDGVISFIASEAEFTPKNVQTEKERVKLVYRIKISIPNQNMELKPGMPADAEIVIGKREPGSGNREAGTGK
ncbi:MAG: HlyD family secretion [Geobacteraceae bacterium]|nr:MAG: HlyD family secretion [Geobacteraceae bacterium]